MSLKNKEKLISMINIDIILELFLINKIHKIHIK